MTAIPAHTRYQGNAYCLADDGTLLAYPIKPDDTIDWLAGQIVHIPTFDAHERAAEWAAGPLGAA